MPNSVGTSFSLHSYGGALLWNCKCFLIRCSLYPPPADAEPYEYLPYWTHAVAGWALFGLGALWWNVRFRGKVEL